MSLLDNELVSSTECHTIFNGGKRKKSFIRVVHVPARELSRKRATAQQNQSVRKLSNDGMANSSVFCGANLELYDCQMLGKRKLAHVFNIAHITNVAVQDNSPNKKKSVNITPSLDICFNDAEVLKMIFDDPKKEDAKVWKERFEQVKIECENFFE